MLIFTPPLTLLAKALCGSLWGLESSLRLVPFLFVVFLFVACSLANRIALKTVILDLLSCIFHLGNCYLVSDLWLVLLFCNGRVVTYGLITLVTDLVLKDFCQVRAHLARLTSDEVILRILVVHAFPCIFFRMFSS